MKITASVKRGVAARSTYGTRMTARGRSRRHASTDLIPVPLLPSNLLSLLLARLCAPAPSLWIPSCDTSVDENEYELGVAISFFCGHHREALTRMRANNQHRPDDDGVKHILLKTVHMLEMS